MSLIFEHDALVLSKKRRSAVHPDYRSFFAVYPIIRREITVDQLGVGFLGCSPMLLLLLASVVYLFTNLVWSQDPGEIVINNVLLLPFTIFTHVPILGPMIPKV